MAALMHVRRLKRFCPLYIYICGSMALTLLLRLSFYMRYPYKIH